jgi:hypothetical protein
LKFSTHKLENDLISMGHIRPYEKSNSNSNNNLDNIDPVMEKYLEKYSELLLIKIEEKLNKK